MTDLEIFEHFDVVIVDSHIVYASGKHGSTYVDKDALYPNTRTISKLCKKIALNFYNGDRVDTVIAPAMGGVILSQRVAEHLTEITRGTVFAVYAEKALTHTGFIIKPSYHKYVAGKRLLVVEDILNTGGTAAKVIATVRQIGGNVVGLGALCNRGGVTSEDVGGVPTLKSLVNIKLDSWDEKDCPLCKSGVPINTKVGHGREFLERQQKA